MASTIRSPAGRQRGQRSWNGGKVASCRGLREGLAEVVIETRLNLARLRFRFLVRVCAVTAIDLVARFFC